MASECDVALVPCCCWLLLLLMLAAVPPSTLPMVLKNTGAARPLRTVYWLPGIMHWIRMLALLRRAIAWLPKLILNHSGLSKKMPAMQRTPQMHDFNTVPGVSPHCTHLPPRDRCLDQRAVSAEQRPAPTPHGVALSVWGVGPCTASSVMRHGEAWLCRPHCPHSSGPTATRNLCCGMVTRGAKTVTDLDPFLAPLACLAQSPKPSNDQPTRQDPAAQRCRVRTSSHRPFTHGRGAKLSSTSAAVRPPRVALGS